MQEKDYPEPFAGRSLSELEGVNPRASFFCEWLESLQPGEFAKIGELVLQGLPLRRVFKAAVIEGRAELAKWAWDFACQNAQERPSDLAALRAELLWGMQQAVEGSDIAVCRVLEGMGADPGRCLNGGSLGEVFRNWRASAGPQQEKFLKHMLARGLSFGDPGQGLEAAIETACLDGNVFLLDKIKECGADFSQAPFDAFSNLLRYCEEGDAKTLRKLIGWGARPGHFAKANPLSILIEGAVNWGAPQREIMEILLEAGASVSGQALSLRDPAAMALRRLDLVWSGEFDALFSKFDWRLSNEDGLSLERMLAKEPGGEEKAAAARALREKAQLSAGTACRAGLAKPKGI